jgi:Uma2 family endonuclease
MAFHTVPTVDDMLCKSKQLNEYIAEQILIFAKEWANDENSQVELVNYLYDEVEKHGADSWADLRWSMLVRRINKLSGEINDTVSRFARH